MESSQSYYEILNISPKASDDDVKRAYHSLAKRFHPDRNPQNRRLAALRFRLVSEAYTGLKTREKRIAYNRGLRLQAGNDNRSARGHNGFFAQISEIFWPAKKEQ